ncbi:hypothetical protein BU16DRAFT_526636 [Lophium mytilinum]|uniref:Uncharacterized protein n=1 Tax=Lophium mytilinum TaxID=390894 RepID=A0A6A6QW56_9PEZI|nr:hypothetical protein BU16DRAFT_526636 [Lophium mytilinum]
MAGCRIRPSDATLKLRLMTNVWSLLSSTACRPIRAREDALFVFARPPVRTS